MTISFVHGSLRWMNLFFKDAKEIGGLFFHSRNRILLKSHHGSTN